MIAHPKDQEALAQIVFAETSTLGLRIHTAERRVQDRRVIEVETAFGKVHGKITSDGSFAPEYEDCKAIAAREGKPLRLILAAAADAYARTRS